MSAKAVKAIREEGLKNIAQGYAIQAVIQYYTLRMKFKRAIGSK